MYLGEESASMYSSGLTLLEPGLVHPGLYQVGAGVLYLLEYRLLHDLGDVRPNHYGSDVI